MSDSRPTLNASQFDRRSFLRYSGLVGLAAGGAATLAACNSAHSSENTDGSKYGRVAVQLSWIKNAEFAGQYFAITKNYFKDAGFGTVDLVAGGAAGTGVEAGLDTGKIWIGTSTPQQTAPAVLDGLRAKIVAATYQKNPFALVSSAAKPINNPQDLIGKKVGVNDSNLLVFQALLAANNINPTQITIVPAQFDPTPLANGEVDGWVGYVTNEPIALAAQGFKNTNFLFADYGLPLVADTLTVLQSTIDNERDKLKAFLKAQIQGWRDAVADPAESTRLAVEVFGKDQNLDPKLQLGEATAQNRLIVSTDTEAHGLLTVTDSLIENNVSSLSKAGISIAGRDLFDMSVLTEVFEENPTLK
jgi:ABC-type nitrate/sulfonate/bicarbonate transport system substrate-binding protein